MARFFSQRMRRRDALGGRGQAQWRAWDPALEARGGRGRVDRRRECGLCASVFVGFVLALAAAGGLLLATGPSGGGLHSPRQRGSGSDGPTLRTAYVEQYVGPQINKGSYVVKAFRESLEETNDAESAPATSEESAAAAAEPAAATSEAAAAATAEAAASPSERGEEPTSLPGLGSPDGKMHAIVFSDRAQAVRAQMLSIAKNSPKALGNMVIHLVANDVSCCDGIDDGIDIDVEVYAMADIERELVEDGITPVWLWPEAKDYFGTDGLGTGGTEWTMKPALTDIDYDKHDSPFDVGRFYMPHFRFARDLDKVIFLDDDVTILGDLTRMWATDIEPDKVMVNNCGGSFVYDAKCFVPLSTPHHAKNTYGDTNTLGAGPFNEYGITLEASYCGEGPKGPAERCVPPGFWEKLQGLVREISEIPAEEEVDLFGHVYWNFGANLINLGAIRANDWTEKLYHGWMRKNFEFKLYPQPTPFYSLGMAYLAWYGKVQCFGDDIRVLEDMGWQRYNTLATLSGWDMRRMKESVTAWHYNGEHKPWMPENTIPFIGRTFYEFFDHRAAEITDPEDPEAALAALGETALWDGTDPGSRAPRKVFLLGLPFRWGNFAVTEWLRASISQHVEVSLQTGVHDKQHLFPHIDAQRALQPAFDPWHVTTNDHCRSLLDKEGMALSDLQGNTTFFPSHVCTWNVFHEWVARLHQGRPEVDYDALCGDGSLLVDGEWVHVREDPDLPENDDILVNIDRYMCQWRQYFSESGVDAAEPTAVLTAFLQSLANSPAPPGGMPVPRLPCYPKVGAEAVGIVTRANWNHAFMSIYRPKNDEKWGQSFDADFDAEPWVLGFGGGTPGRAAPPQAPDLFRALAAAGGGPVISVTLGAELALVAFLRSNVEGFAEEQGPDAPLGLEATEDLQRRMKAFMIQKVHWEVVLERGAEDAGLPFVRFDLSQCAHDMDSPGCLKAIYTEVGVTPDPPPPSKYMTMVDAAVFPSWLESEFAVLDRLTPSSKEALLAAMQEAMASAATWCGKMEEAAREGAPIYPN